MAKNLFDKSKAKATVKKVEKHEIVTIAKTYEKDVTRLMEIDIKLAELEAERTSLDFGIREEAKYAMIKRYTEKNAFPGTLKVMAGTKCFMFITSDKYVKIDENRANELVETYGDEIVSEKSVFTLNPELVDKYSEEISNLIMKSKKITEVDKENLIQCCRTWNISKGMIEKLRNTTFAKFDINQLVEDIKPIFSIKLPKE